MNKERELGAFWGRLGASLLLLCLCLCLTGSAEAAHYHVTQSGAGTQDGLSWGNALGEDEFRTKLDTASSGDVFWVARGAYRPALPSDVGSADKSFWIRDGVKLFGGFTGTETKLEQRDWKANVTVLTGDLENNDHNKNNGATVSADRIVGTNSRTVVYTESCSPATVLNGFTVCGGSKPSPYGSGGSGMLNAGGSKPIVANCTFSGNRAKDNGGGMCNLVGSDAIVLNCTFSGNKAQWGGGMYNLEESTPTVANCTFSGNRATKWGGGMQNAVKSKPTLTNCTFSGYWASVSGSGMLNYRESRPTLANCILWEDEPISNDAGSSAAVNTCIVRGGYYAGGVNVISANPRLAIWLSNNGGPTQTFELLAGSSAIDAGLDVGAVVFGSVTVPKTDQRGWIRQGRTDIGAVEIGATPAHSIIVIPSENGTIDPSGDIKVDEGLSKTFTITPGSGYAIQDVTVDGVSIGAKSSYTFTNVTKDGSITATFHKDPGGVPGPTDPGIPSIKPDSWVSTLLNADGKGNMTLKLEAKLTSGSAPISVAAIVSGLKVIPTVELLDETGAVVAFGTIKAAKVKAYTLRLICKTTQEELDKGAEIVSILLATADGKSHTLPVNKKIKDIPKSDGHGPILDDPDPSSRNSSGGCDAGVNGLALALAGLFLLRKKAS